uniref:Putative major capsid protein n=1 Tax=Gokushovirinae environmental samples TaxID=1478972 RepID=A0A2R3UAC0_9VIRU|nr:putative major capsid protein [Gokushovirinae environmental samples]
MMAFQNRSVNVHQFAMIPKSDIPRSSFKVEKMHKTTIDAGYLYPVWVDEVLPGDTFNLKMTAFGRLATPIFPVMDNLWLDSFFFFVPNRLVWSHWENFMGEQTNPGDSIAYVIPYIQSANGGFPILGIYDYMGLPTVGQVDGAETVRVNALPMRAYNLIYNEWFRDENLQNSLVVSLGDGPDNESDYALRRRGKRKDYFTGALPFPQKGPSVSLPLGTSAPVIGNGKAVGLEQAGGNNYGLATTTAAPHQLMGYFSDYNQPLGASSGGATILTGDARVGITQVAGQSGMIADLSAATAATINQLRQSFQIQKLLERDARGGTRYTEIIRAHFGVISPDARLQRPEYLGGGSQRISINPVAQTSATASGDTPQGNLAAMGTVLAHGHGFTQSFTEHGTIIGLVSVRADLTYQQGLRKMWSRRTRHDFYFPAFAMLGEQAILNQEIYATGIDASDEAVFGYQERWAEYRYNPSMITGLFRSTSAGTIDAWHLAQKFTSLPTLNATFIQDTPPLDRVIAVGSEANGQQMILDMFFSMRAARPMPMYSVPGLIDHF